MVWHGYAGVVRKVTVFDLLDECSGCGAGLDLRGIIYDEAVTNDCGWGDVERKPESSAERFPPVDVLVLASG